MIWQRLLKHGQRNDPRVFEEEPRSVSEKAAKAVLRNVRQSDAVILPRVFAHL